MSGTADQAEEGRVKKARAFAPSSWKWRRRTVSGLGPAGSYVSANQNIAIPGGGFRFRLTA